MEPTANQRRADLAATAGGWHNRLRREVLLAYGGGSCAGCGFRPENPLELELDHVNGDGAEHRRRLGARSSSSFHSALRRLSWPADPPLQTLCAGCHREKSRREQMGDGYIPRHDH